MSKSYRRQRGFSLIELMVSLAVALFLVGGVVTMLGNTRHTYKTQSGLAQLQVTLSRRQLTVVDNTLYFTSGFQGGPWALNSAGTAVHQISSFAASDLTAFGNFLLFEAPWLAATDKVLVFEGPPQRLEDILAQQSADGTQVGE